MSPGQEIQRPQRYTAIVLLALVAYWPTFSVGFLWDDHVMIENNPALLEWSSRTLAHDFTSDVFDGHGDPYYRPAQTILNRIDYTIWKLRPFGYHLTNWVGHATNALLVQELVLLLGLGNLAGLLAGCLFAVNPVPVEQLIIIAGRAEIYGLTFLLVSLLLLLQKDKRKWIWGYAAYAVALFFKESTVAAPLLLASLYAYRREPKIRYARLLPLFILDIPYLWLRHQAVGPLLPHSDLLYTTKFFILAFPRVLFDYARLVLVPWNLHSHHLMPGLSHAWPLFLLALTGLFVYLIRRRKYLGLWGLSWFALALLPKTPVMIYGNFRLDHFAYSALIGIVVVLADGYAKLWQKHPSGIRYVLAMTFFPLIIFWALMVHLNVALRGTDEKMYRWALHFTTSNPIKYNLGLLLMQTGRSNEALPYLGEAHACYPDDPQNTYALALACLETGHPVYAVKLLKSIQSIYPPAQKSLLQIRTAAQHPLRETKETKR